MKKCRITITTAQGVETFDGLYRSTIAAVIDAKTRIGMAPGKIKVQVIV